MNLREVAVRPVRRSEEQHFQDLMHEHQLLDFSNGNRTREFHLRTKDGKDRSFTLELLGVEPSRIRVRVRADSPVPRLVDAFKSVDFYVSYFSMPFMRNTRLEDGTRFSVTLQNMDPTTKTATARIIRFPDAYMSLRDRPWVDELYGKLQQNK